MSIVYYWRLNRNIDLRPNYPSTQGGRYIFHGLTRTDFEHSVPGRAFRPGTEHGSNSYRQQRCTGLLSNRHRQRILFDRSIKTIVFWSYVTPDIINGDRLTSVVAAIRDFFNGLNHFYARFYYGTTWNYFHKTVLNATSLKQIIFNENEDHLKLYLKILICKFLR